MTELAFPILGLLFVFLVVLPSAALVSKASLWLLQRLESKAGLHGNAGLRYALLVGPSAIPLAWIISACLHQAETGTDPEVCIVRDKPGVLCPEVAMFAGAIILLVAMAAVPRILREQRAVRRATSHLGIAARERIEKLAAEDPEVGLLLRRLIVTDRCDVPIVTLGLFMPYVAIRTTFALELDDDALLASLKHEAQHVHDRDPLRYFVAWWALSVNPIGRYFLGPELARWIVARETHCDREAVLTGASAPALAHALVVAARSPAPAMLATSALGASSSEVLRLRVSLLMAYADRVPKQCCPAPALGFAVYPLVIALLLPHHVGVGALDTLHRAAESAAALSTSVWR